MSHVGQPATLPIRVFDPHRRSDPGGNLLAPGELLASYAGGRPRLSLAQRPDRSPQAGRAPGTRALGAGVGAHSRPAEGVARASRVQGARSRGGPDKERVTQVRETPGIEPPQGGPDDFEVSAVVSSRRSRSR